MLVMRTTENLTDPVGELVSTEQPVGFCNLALAVNPLGLYGVKPRALLGQKTAHDPHPFAALLDSSVVLSEPAPDLLGDVPGSVVPDENHDLLADSFELLQAPLKELGRYATDRPSINEAHPRIVDLWQVESVAGDGFRLGVVFGDRLLDEAKGLARICPTAQGGQSHPAPPALITETHRPAFRIRASHFHQSVAPPFFLSYKGSGEVIHRLARIHRTPRMRERVARTVSPETRLPVSPSSKAASAAIARVHRLLSYPNSLGERWSISLKSSALLCSKASRVLLGREDLATRASRPLWLKSWMASRTVCCPQPRLWAILGAYSPLELARNIWHRRKVKVFFERSPAWRASRSSSENERTKIGVFMDLTVTRRPKPVLKMH